MTPPLVPFLSRSALCAAALLAAGACSQSGDTAEPLGQVDLSLLGRAPSGTLYRLRDAQLAIRPTSQVVRTEDDPDRPVLSIRLDPGAYALDLLDGWRLERVDASGAVTVPATLLSPDPQPFAIVADEITALSLRFHVAGGDVGTGQGGLDVSLDIVEDAVDADAGVPDAAVRTRYQYVVDRIEIPTSATDRLRLDLDLDGDLDNRFGAALAALSHQSAGALDLQHEVDRGVARGESILLVDLLASSFQADPDATLRTHRGASPAPAPCRGPDDDICGGHLGGDGTFVIAPSTPSGQLPAQIADGRLQTGSSDIELVLPFPGTPLVLPLTVARAEMTGLSASSIRDGIVGGGLPASLISSTIIPWLTAQITTVVARDCTGGEAPPCGCSGSSGGTTLLRLFDRAPLDCAITAAEVESTPFVRVLLAPDLDVQPRDGTNDSLSVVFGVRAVRASYPE